MIIYELDSLDVHGVSPSDYPIAIPVERSLVEGSIKHALIA